jgi:predicted naringenin-chalcone synthase
MSSIVATATRSAQFEYAQPKIKEHAVAWLNGSSGGLQSALSAFDNGLVARRSSSLPLADVFRVRGLEESNDLYIERSIELATAVTEEALRNAGLRATDVDLFVSTSCTGFMIPSVDAHVAERLKMKPSMRRLPITEHGCAGGAVALAFAHDHLVAHPGHRALVVAVELPSLTFQYRDRSPANVVSAALFGDGAAAVVLSSAPTPGRPRIVRAASHRFADSLDWMGFQLKDSGLHIVLSKEIPRHVRTHARALIDGFLAESGLALGDVRHFLFHPGGRKILEAFEATLGLPKDGLAASRAVLRAHGNLSSATVLFILEEQMKRVVAQPGERGLLIAFGPGFGAELLLLQWD